jgi:L-lactate dehydrogenase complex protein LldF
MTSTNRNLKQEINEKLMDETLRGSLNRFCRSLPHRSCQSV